MNNTRYKFNKRRIKENGEHPWLGKRKTSVSEYGMELVDQKKRRKK